MLIKPSQEKKLHGFQQKFEHNVHNIGVINSIKDTKKNYFDHMFAKNSIIERFAKWKFGGVGILDLPVCEKCEKPGAWHDKPVGSCYCFACGHTTVKTMMFRDYLAQELKEFRQEQLEMLEQITDSGYLEQIERMEVE